MSLIYNGTTIKKLIYNGTTIKSGIYNGTKVFSGETIYVWNKYDVTAKYTLEKEIYFAPSGRTLYGYAISVNENLYGSHFIYFQDFNYRSKNCDGLIYYVVLNTTSGANIYYWVEGTYSKGTTSYGTVTSTDRSAYPDSGTPDNTYWYEYVGIQE